MATATRTKPAGKKVTAEWPFRYEVLPLELLEVNEEYQRPLTTFVDKIEKNYDPAMVQTLIVSERVDPDGHTWYAVIDGQTRMTAMRKRGESHAPCVVYAGLTQSQEAALFSKFQTERRGMTSASRFRAQVIAKDLNATVIDALVQDEGYYIDANDIRGDGTAIRAVSALEYVFWDCSGSKRPRNRMDNANPELLKQTLRVIRTAWPPPHPTAVSSVVIRGIGQYLKDHANDSDFDEGKLVTRLKKVQPSELARRAEQLREGRGMTGNSPVYLADAVSSEYRRRGGR